MYFLANCVGLDVLCMDTKTSTNDLGTVPQYQWNGLQKITDWQKWLRKLAVFDPAKYGRPQANAATLDLWFAEAYSRIPGTLTPSRHAEAVATDVWGIINYVLPNDVACWMRWQPEGRTAADPATAHSISLWYDKGSPNSLRPTEAYAAYVGLVEHFGPGAKLFKVDTKNTNVTGIASETRLCLVSRSSSPQDFVYKGVTTTLKPYGVAMVLR